MNPENWTAVWFTPKSVSVQELNVLLTRSTFPSVTTDHFPEMLLGKQQCGGLA